MDVFERGIKAIALSADLWIHYLNHVKTEFGSKPEFIRVQYERAIEACGKEWRSDKLWDHFVKWEVQVLYIYLPRKFDTLFLRLFFLLMSGGEGKRRWF